MVDLLDRRCPKARRLEPHPTQPVTRDDRREGDKFSPAKRPDRVHVSVLEMRATTRPLRASMSATINSCLIPIQNGPGPWSYCHPPQAKLRGAIFSLTQLRIPLAPGGRRP